MVSFKHLFFSQVFYSPNDCIRPGYVQYDDTFVIVAGELDVYQYEPITESMQLRPGGQLLSRVREANFAMLIDGSILNCV